MDARTNLNGALVHDQSCHIDEGLPQPLPVLSAMWMRSVSGHETASLCS